MSRIIPPTISSTPTSGSIDIDQYIRSYSTTSETRILRLLFFARNPKIPDHDRKRATNLLEKQLRTAGNVKRYNSIFDTDSLSHVAELMEYDPEFCETTTKKNDHQFDTLSANLRTSRATLAKESIYQSIIQIARHLMMTGRLREAMGQLVNVRGYCSGVWELQEMTLLLAEVCLALGEYPRARDLYDPGMNRRHAGSVDDNSTYRKAFLSKLNAAKGVAYLAEGNMDDAANCFLSVTGELRKDFNSVISNDDIALYGGLSALIAMDRKELGRIFPVDKNSGVIKEGNSFRERLNVHPELNDAIQAYIRADYGECLRLVETVRKGWEMDIYLAPQADSLWSKVRGKCLVQYFEPYSSVSLQTVMNLFAFKSLDEVEDVVADLIERKEIVNAKIDGVNQTLNDTSVGELERNARRKMIRKLGRTGDRLLDEVDQMLLRMTCTDKGVIVGKISKAKKSSGRRRGWGDAMQESDSGSAMWGLCSSDEDGGDMVMEDESDLMMDTTDVWS